jgi:hypothetical protein
VVIAETDPPPPSVPCALVTWPKRAALVNWTQDLFPEIAESLHVPGIALFAAVLRWMRNLSLRLSRLPLPAMREQTNRLDHVRMLFLGHVA